MELNPYKIGKVLVRGGYTKTKDKSSHAKFKKEGSPTIIISEHKGKNIDRNIFFKIVRTANLPEELRSQLM